MWAFTAPWASHSAQYGNGSIPYFPKTTNGLWALVNAR